MYEDWSAGRITEYNFNLLTKKYQAEQLELEEKIGFAARSRALREGISQLEALAREVRFSNASSYAPNSTVARAADEMLRVIDSLGDV